MKCGVFKLDSGAIAAFYEADGLQPTMFGGELGDPALHVHMEIPGGVDQRAAKLVDGEVVEDAALKLAAQKADVRSAISRAMAFGNTLITEFAADNVMLGITVDGMTGAVLDKMASVAAAATTGSLYEAIARIKAIPEEDKDAKYITDARLLELCNKVETYLNIPLSESL